MQKRKYNKTPNDNARKRPSGFALIGILIFMPVLIAILFGLYDSAKWLTRYTDRQSLCENQLFSLQNSLADDLNKLFSLNKEARALRLSYGLASAQLAAAVMSTNLIAIARAEKKLIKIRAQKNRLQAKQDFYLLSMQTKIVHGKMSIQSKLRKNQVKSKIPKMQIQAESTAEVGSPYETLPQFSLLQTAVAEYSIRNAEDQGQTKNKLFFCKATIEDRQGTFRAALRGNGI